MSGHVIFLLPGSQRNFTGEAERAEFCSARYVKGQTSIEGSTGFIDVDKARPWRDGRWMIWGWFTEKRSCPT